MTTTNPYGAPPPTPAFDQRRRLRRSRTDRVGAGVAGGLGEYFGLDPVLFRVLFATAAFFGGAGILAYLLAWAAIPDAGTERAAIDGWVSSLRRRKVPIWLVAAGAGLLLWLVAFSWWAPGPLFPVLAVVILLVVAFARRGRDISGADISGADISGADISGVDMSGVAPMPTVSLDKATGEIPTWTSATASTRSEARSWVAESFEAARIRRRRAAPVRLATLAVLALTLTVLGLIDAARGIVIPAYLWAALGILLGGLVIGAALRRTPWGIAWLLVPSAVALFAFAGTRASLHDGVGQHEWQPKIAPASHYRLAFGQGVLDLRTLQPQTQPRTVDITLAGGQVRILAPRTLNLTLAADVHLGQLSVDGRTYDDGAGSRAEGLNFTRTVNPAASATGQPITINVHVSAGNIELVRI
jgi:phage shock protein PspC (stress-responsive transcriptional regulator)